MNSTKEISITNLELPETINDIALIEVKKLNEGRSTSDDKEINMYAKIDKDFIKEQIDLINPDIILCCYTGEAYADHLFIEDAWEKLISISKCNCYKDFNRLVIDFYHPSTRSDERAKELFDILCKMIKEGNVFKKFSWNN